PTIRLFFVNVFVGDGVLDVPKLVFDRIRAAKGGPYILLLDHFINKKCQRAKAEYAQRPK
ncbi:MAG: hypothetical protein WBK46_13585, partial [Ruminococcus flavefaciens]